MSQNIPNQTSNSGPMKKMEDSSCIPNATDDDTNNDIAVSSKKRCHEQIASSSYAAADTKSANSATNGSNVHKNLNKNNTSNTNSMNPKNQKPKRPKTKHLDPKILHLRRTLQKCCASNDLPTAISIYEQMHVQEKVKMEAQSYYNLLNLCEGSIGAGRERIHVGTPKDTKNSNNDNKNTTNANTSSAVQKDESQVSSTDNDEEYAISENAPITLQQRKEFAFRLKQHMDEHQYPLNETAYSALIKLLCKIPSAPQSTSTIEDVQHRSNNDDDSERDRKNDFIEAQKLLKEAHTSSHCKPRLRLYSSLLMAMCHRGDMEGALNIWALMSSTTSKYEENQKLRQQQQQQRQSAKNHNGIDPIVVIEPTEREYCAMMKCATQTGDADVMELLLSNLAEDVLVPSLETTDSIVKWFESPHAKCQGNEVSCNSVLKKVPNLPKSNAPTMGPVHYSNNNTTNEADNVEYQITSNDTINSTTGILTSGCLQGFQLQPVPLNDSAWLEMMEMNENIVLKGEVEQHGKQSIYAGGGKGKKRFVTSKEDVEKRILDWNTFRLFLEEKIGPCQIGEPNTTAKQHHHHHQQQQPEKAETEPKRKKYDIIIDGANVGYFKQNFANAPKHVDYNQIDWVVQHFLQLGKKVLLVLHERHFSRKLMPHWAKSIVQRWDESGDLLYRSPFGSNDDWFWMHAALWCGRGTMVLSNDEMRDHHFQMLAHRSFLRWKERHRVTFSFGERCNSSVGGFGRWTRKVILTYPQVYSRRIQRVGDDGVLVPLPKRGDENRFLDGCHEADESTPTEETYTCISLKKR